MFAFTFVTIFRFICFEGLSKVVKEPEFSFMLHHFYSPVCTPSLNLCSLPDGPFRSVKSEFSLYWYLLHSVPRYLNMGHTHVIVKFNFLVLCMCCLVQTDMLIFFIIWHFKIDIFSY